MGDGKKPRIPALKPFQAYLLLGCITLLMLVANALCTPVWYDDAGHWHVAREVASSGSFCYQLNSQTGECDPASQYISIGPLLTYPAAALVKAGAHAQGLRWLVVAFTLGMLGVLLLLARRLTGAPKAAWALLLVVGNIQLLTYGAQFLGETPMLLFLLLGFALLARGAVQGKAAQMGGAAVAWACAALVKESVLLPLGLGLILWMGYLIFARKWKLLPWALVLGLLPILVLAITHLALQGSITALMAFYQGRTAYAGEFFALDLGESLGYLALKPVIWLGLVAMVVKVRVKRQPQDVAMLCLALGQLVWFVLGAGYDRHGFQLIFLPAVYLAEFAAFGWRWLTSLRRKGWLPRVAFLALVVGFSFQQTPYLMGKRFLARKEVNAEERWVAAVLQEQGIQKVFTYDQQLLPFLPAEMHYRLERVVPHAAQHCAPLVLRSGEVLVAGMYARELYQDCVEWDALEIINRSPGGQYEILMVRQRNYACW